MQHFFENLSLFENLPMETNQCNSSETEDSPKKFKYSPKKLNHYNQSFSFGKRSKKFSNSDEPKKQKSSNQCFTRVESCQAHQPENNECKKLKDFRYGNYHQYYGYRNQGFEDPRLQCMKREWFDQKDVLDIGCNSGQFTLALARDFNPQAIIGIDIDETLVKMAKRNVRHYLDPEKISDDDFPISFPLCHGPVAQVMDLRERYPPGNFPFNVQFLECNYIFPCDELLHHQEECFDTILCLSITKWIHLNWGDAGIKRMFKRIFRQLRPGGVLILEAQDYRSYAKKKKVTGEVFKHYYSIVLYPEMFNEYLLKEVGFENCELIDTPAHSSQGFSRPLYLFSKGGMYEANVRMKPKHIIFHSDSEDNCGDSDAEQLSD